MCSILGFINLGSESLLKECNSVMMHRGPDGSNIKWFDKFNSGLAHNRLSIIDLSDRASQPMQSLNKRYWIVFNGEIYNYKSIRKELNSNGFNFATESDTEVLLNAYLEWGSDCFNKFNGIFAFAIFDNLENSLILARDRLGVKPLYYYINNNSFIFASEIKGILASKFVSAEPDMEALHTPIHYQIGPKTGFNNIYKLRPGYYSVYKEGEFQ